MRENLTLEEIDKFVYGNNGLLDRVVNEIKLLGFTGCVEKTGIKRQFFWNLVKRYNDDKIRNHIKVTTIFETAKKLEVD